MGSEDSRSIGEIAQAVASYFSPPFSLERVSGECLGRQAAPADIYVPSTFRARSELGLKPWIVFEEGIRRTFHFYERDNGGI